MDFSGVRRRLGAVTGEVRRALLVRRRLWSGVCAAVAVLAAARVLAPPEPPTTPVLVAARALAAGEVVGPRDVTSTAMPATAVPDGAAASPVGRTLAGSMAPGEVLTEARFVGRSLLAGRDGVVAMPVRIPDAEVVDLLRVGDRVDLFAADPAAATPEGERLVVAALVLALPTLRGRTAERGRLVVLEVTPDQGAAISGRAARGLLAVALSR